MKKTDPKTQQTVELEILDLEGASKTVALVVKAPVTDGDRRGLAAHVISVNASGLAGDRLATCAETAFAMLKVGEDQLEGLDPTEQVLLGWKLAQWGARAGQGN